MIRLDSLFPHLSTYSMYRIETKKQFRHSIIPLLTAHALFFAPNGVRDEMPTNPFWHVKPHTFAVFYGIRTVGYSAILFRGVPGQLYRRYISWWPRWDTGDTTRHDLASKSSWNNTQIRIDVYMIVPHLATTEWNEVRRLPSGFGRLEGLQGIFTNEIRNCGEWGNGAIRFINRCLDVIGRRDLVDALRMGADQACPLRAAGN